MPVEVKICGLTNAVDALAALDAGADYLGFVLYPKSPRCITPAALKQLLAENPRITRSVGLFVNVPAAEVQAIALDCGLYAAQIHGDEPAAGYTDLTVPVWRAVWQREGAWRPDPAQWPAARYVVDATVPGQYGGTGVRADWDAAAALAETHGIMLAGGLTPENVAEAVRRVRPVGVDVSSGVESEPGRKDHARMAAFIRAAKAA